MVKRSISLLLVLLMICGLFTACSVVDNYETAEESTNTLEIITDAEDESDRSNTQLPVETEEDKTEAETEAENTEEVAAITEDGEYSTPEEVADYIHTYGHLPSNYISKSKAENLGWDSSLGNLWDVAPGKSIGGNKFGNYEGILPKGNYRECDVNYEGGYRGAERLIYDDQGHVYYTNDHYETFTQLY